MRDGHSRFGSVRLRAAATVAALVTTAALLPALAAPAAGVTVRKASAWLPYWAMSQAYASFQNNAALYDEAHLFLYEMKSSTSVALFSGATEDATIVSGIKAKGVRVVPTVSNNFDAARVETMLSTASNRTAHVNTLLNLVLNKGYDGIDVDYENLKAGDRTNFTSFIQQLASTFHAKGKRVEVCVYGKTSEPGTWDGPQAENYAALGAAADRINIMTYDYHWNTSPAGPIAPVSWVDQVAAFAAQSITPSKVALGMNLYGYDWVGSNGDSQMWNVLEGRRTSYGATKNWDATNDESWFKYTASGVSHTVWYGDNRSVASRLPIVDKYNLSGPVFWHVGGEDPAVWTVVRNRWTPTTTTTTSPTNATTATTAAPAQATLPSAPQNLRVTSTSGGISLAWDAPSVGPVQYYKVCGGSRGAETCSWTTTATTFKDASVAMWAYKYYRVAAVNSAGQGPYSNEVGALRNG